MPCSAPLRRNLAETLSVPLSRDLWVPSDALSTQRSTPSETPHLSPKPNWTTSPILHVLHSAEDVPQTVSSTSSASARDATSSQATAAKRAAERQEGIQSRTSTSTSTTAYSPLKTRDSPSIPAEQWDFPLHSASTSRCPSGIHCSPSSVSVPYSRTKAHEICITSDSTLSLRIQCATLQSSLTVISRTFSTRAQTSFSTPA